MPIFSKITILSLSLVNFRVSRFHVSHLTYETFKLCLQNTLNMSKTAKVYFGVLHDPKEAAKIRTRSARFTNHKGSLYKRGFFTPILKCIARKDTEYVLREVHEGICENHIEARALAGKVLRQGYYWPIILRDATDLVRRCKICQEHAKISRLPSEPLTSITSPWPFQQWGLDILRPLPIGKGQCKFIIVAVDYFTKWAEAEPLAIITEQKIRNFVWRAIICRFCIPRALVSDNGK